MAYTINKTDGTTLTILADGTVNDTSTELTLVGKNYAGYGQFLNTNIVHLLENFSDDTAPNKPLTGQLWWDTQGNLKVYNGTAFKTLSSITSSTAQPASAVTGNSWWDTVNSQYYVYNGASWTLVGPAFGSNTGTSGTIVGTITDTGNVSHVAVNVFVADQLMTIISSDDTYTPQASITGFTTIKPGFNLIGTAALANVAYYGTASDSSTLGNVAAANYARTDIAETFDNTVTINNNSGLTVGTGTNFTTSISGTTTQLTSNNNNANIAVRVNVGGLVTNAITVVGANARVDFANAITTAGNVTARSTGYIIAQNTDNATSNVTGAMHSEGGISAKKTIYTSGNVTSEANINGVYFTGVAVGALYSDLAERYFADAVYEPGTVLTLGGEQEVTLCNEENSIDVFGVVSTDPAYLMNSLDGIEDIRPTPAIAMVGRVPVKVTGQVKKGQRLVSAANGYAQAAPENVNPLAIIGRSLEDKLNDAQGVVEAVVRINI
tara:strand:+ start:2727 stop:4208 length:1482 start_codon:yes stop_codon:yes gene_type:complete